MNQAEDIWKLPEREFWREITPAEEDTHPKGRGSYYRWSDRRMLSIWYLSSAIELARRKPRPNKLGRHGALSHPSAEVGASQRQRRFLHGAPSYNPLFRVIPSNGGNEISLPGNTPYLPITKSIGVRMY